MELIATLPQEEDSAQYLKDKLAAQNFLSGITAMWLLKHFKIDARQVHCFLIVVYMRA